MGWLDGKGVCLYSIGQRIKSHEWCCVVNNGMLIEYSPIEFLEYVLKLIMWPTYLGDILNLA